MIGINNINELYLVIIQIGPIRVHALPIAVAAEQSVHYFVIIFLSFSATYFSPRRGCAAILKFWSERHSADVATIVLGVIFSSSF